MDLQNAVFLLCALFTTGRCNFCYECIGVGNCAERLVICPSKTSKCESTTVVRQIGDFSYSTKVKNCAADCGDFSMNLGVVRSSSTCCDAPFCNYRDAPDPRTFAPNGKKCHYCDGKSCSNVVSCSGSEDRCITGIGTFTGRSAVIKGCVSKSFCNQTCDCIKDVSCCEGDLCNSKEAVNRGSTRDVDERVFKHVTQGIIHSVTQNVKYNGPKQSSMFNDAKSVKLTSVYKDGKRAKQSSTYNSAKSVSQSFLFLCASLLSFIILH